jgi:hypothetical protein
MPLQVVKKYSTATTLSCISLSVIGLLSWLTNEKDRTAPMAGNRGLAKPGITIISTIKNPMTRMPKNKK